MHQSPLFLPTRKTAVGVDDEIKLSYLEYV